MASKRKNQPSRKGLKGPPAKKVANALRRLAPVRDVNPAAPTFSTSLKGRDTDPAKSVRPRRG
jgi:hypothetical protein